MATKWTDEQKKVIETRHRNLLVSAAAGSGKTAVLVERIIRMITDPEHPVDIDKLLKPSAGTFPRAGPGSWIPGGGRRRADALKSRCDEGTSGGILRKGR